MKIRRIAVLILIMVLSMSLTGCIKIKVKDVEIGKSAGADGDWESLKNEFDVLVYVPKLSDKVDYYCLNSDLRGDGVDIAFKEVKNPKEYADKLIVALENAGFTYDGDLCLTNWGRCTDEEITENHYNCMNYTLEADGKTINVFLEYFDLIYDNSHNVFLRIVFEK